MLDGKPAAFLPDMQTGYSARTLNHMYNECSPQEREDLFFDIYTGK